MVTAAVPAAAAIRKISCIGTPFSMPTHAAATILSPAPTVEFTATDELLQKYELPLNTAFNVGDNSFFRKYMNRLAKEFSSKKSGSEDFIEITISLKSNFSSKLALFRSFVAIFAIKRKITFRKKQNPAQGQTVFTQCCKVNENN